MREIESFEAGVPEGYTPTPKPPRRPWTWWVGTKWSWAWVLVPVAGCAALVLCHVFVRIVDYETTDDAFIDAHVVAIAPRVAGQVRTVPVVDNQQVKKGDLLVAIDPVDYRTELNAKAAAVTTEDASYKTVKASFDYIQATVATASAELEKAKAEEAAAEASAAEAVSNFQRQKELRQREVVSPQEYDAAQAAARTAQANLEAARQKVAASASKLTEAKAQRSAARTYVQMAQAKVAQAKIEQTAANLKLSYTEVHAPCDGKVTRKRVEAGSYVTVGQPLMALVPPETWVVANFKETQLAQVRPGQPVEIEVDAYPGRRFSGHVASIQSGSGARFSLLPPENAVGNFVKVVQRVPVKILFDDPPGPGLTLGPGMSVVPLVRVRNLRIPLLGDVGAAGGAGLATAGLVGWILRRKRTRQGEASETSASK